MFISRFNLKVIGKILQIFAFALKLAYFVFQRFFMNVLYTLENLNPIVYLPSQTPPWPQSFFQA